MNQVCPKPLLSLTAGVSLHCWLQEQLPRSWNAIPLAFCQQSQWGNLLVKVLKTQSRKQGSCKYPAGKGENGLALLWVTVIAPCGKQVGGGKAAAQTTRKLFQGTSWIENSAKYIYLKIKWT